MLNVTFYADESGIHDPHGEQPGSEVAAIGGYIATKEQWERFERRWKTALRKYKVRQLQFHMSEFYLKEPPPPYDKWTATKKKTFLRTMMRIAHDNTLFGYASMVETKAWDAILDDAAKTAPNPYFLCFQNFFAKFQNFLKEDFDPHVSKGKPIEDIAFVFHQHQEFGAAAEAGFAISKRISDPDDRLSSITFGSSKEYVPLQAADLFAFFARRRFTRHLKRIPQDEFESQLLAHENVRLIFLSPDNLRDLQQNRAKAEPNSENR